MATEEKKTEDVEKVLADMKAVVEKEFAEKLAKLGYRADSGKSKRSRQKIGARCGRHAEKRKPRLDERELVNALALFPRWPRERKDRLSTAPVQVKRCSRLTAAT